MYIYIYTVIHKIIKHKMMQRIPRLTLAAAARHFSRPLSSAYGASVPTTLANRLQSHSFDVSDKFHMPFTGHNAGREKNDYRHDYKGYQRIRGDGDDGGGGDGDGDDGGGGDDKDNSGKGMPRDKINKLVTNIVLPSTIIMYLISQNTIDVKIIASQIRDLERDAESLAKYITEQIQQYILTESSEHVRRGDTHIMSELYTNIPDHLRTLVIEKIKIGGVACEWLIDYDDLIKNWFTTIYKIKGKQLPSDQYIMDIINIIRNGVVPLTKKLKILSDASKFIRKVRGRETEADKKPAEYWNSRQGWAESADGVNKLLAQDTWLAMFVDGLLHVFEIIEPVNTHIYGPIVTNYIIPGLEGLTQRHEQNAVAISHEATGERMLTTGSDMQSHISSQFGSFGDVDTLYGEPIFTSIMRSIRERLHRLLAIPVNIYHGTRALPSEALKFLEKTRWNQRWKNPPLAIDSPSPRLFETSNMSIAGGQGYKKSNRRRRPRRTVGRRIAGRWRNTRSKSIRETRGLRRIKIHTRHASHVT